MEKTNFKSIVTFTLYIFLSTIGVFIMINIINSYLPEIFLDCTGNYSDNGYLLVQSLINFTIYLILFILLLIIYKKELFLDYKKTKFDSTFTFKEVVKAFLYLLLFSFLGNYITSLFTETESVNQSSIVELVLSKYAIFSIISTLVLAVFVEEIVYRKAIISFLKNFNFLNNKTIILISGFFFGIIHIIFTGDFLHFFSYFFPGTVLGYYYIKKNHNIWFSISLHFMNNLLSIISILILSLLDYSNL